MIRLPYPVSANRYWRVFGARVVRSPEANAYRAAVGLIARSAGIRPLSGRVSVYVGLAPRLTKRGQASATRLDLDNALKVVLDSLNGVAYQDDSQIVRIVAEVVDPYPGGAVWFRAEPFRVIIDDTTTGEP